MRRTTTSTLVLLSFLWVGCGGSCPRAGDAHSAESAEADDDDDDDEKSDAVSEHSEEASDDGDEHGEKASAGEKSEKSDEPKSDEKKSGSGGPEPTFPDHGSVSQAIAAVPSGTQRANIEPDVLAEPLQKPELYEPCKVGAQHFKLKVAIWDGHAVGVDVTTANKKLAECIDRQVRTVEWREKVRSLNTVEYSM